VKVAFDHQIFALQSYGGISRYVVRLAQGLIALGDDVQVIAPLHRNRHLKELPQGRVRGLEVDRFPPKTGRLIGICNHFLTSRSMKKLNPDVIHQTYYSSWSSVTKQRARRILTVHDMIHERFPEEFPAQDPTTASKRVSVARADHIICISQSTRNDLCEIFGVPSEKVSVVHHGFERFGHGELGPASSCVQKPFLLYVGSRGGYKNFKRMLQAIAASPQLKAEFDVVAFGGGAFSSDERRLIGNLGFRAESVRQLAGDDQVLGDLYRAATALVYPSLYEGFGLPPLEAMAHLCPVVTSNAGPMPEIVGRAGEYFDPADLDSLSNALERVVFDEQRRQDLIAAGGQNLARFSWERCAMETRAIYRNVLQSEVLSEYVHGQD
jgi:glycosyltransferase involved in cell wall biosynthesis